ncbi:MAG: GerAB/ArcD/ProY family transporter [Eubacteriales bacterium SKADARSKE-1]|nr:GerAB/ArcD/ProY family transporter [Eubacteriales bacterium SKADARSKE-1]
MGKEYKISPYQIFSMFFLIHIFTALTYSPKLSFSKGLWDLMLSAIISLLLSFVLETPSYVLYKKYQSCNMFSGKLGVVYMIIYAIYFIWVACYVFSLMRVFIISVMSPETPVILLSIFAFMGAMYSAHKGVHAIARTSVMIVFFVFLSLIFIALSLLPKIKTENYLPFMSSGAEETINGVIYMMSRNFSLPAIAVILPLIEGNKKATLTIWNVVTHFFSLIIIFLTVGSLGKYLETQIFQIYSVTRIAEVGVFRRLDAVYVATLAMGSFITFSEFCYFFSFVCSNIKKQTVKEISVLLGAIAIFVFGLCIPQSKEFYYFIFNRYILLIYNIIAAFILPLIFLVKKLIIENRSKRK